MNRLWQRILDLVNPPAYPDYAEYKDQDEAAAVPIADDSAVKSRRLKMVAIFSVVLSLAGGAWIYAQGDLLDEKDQKSVVDPSLATEMLKEMAPEEKAESLDDVKRWAQQLEASVVRDARDTRQAGRVPLVARPVPPVPYEPYVPYVPPARADTVTQPSEPAAPPVVATPEPPAPSYPATPRTAETPRTDTPTGRYQPRRYEPIILEPRTVDPY